MKVISKPDFENWKKEVTCFTCRAVLEISAKDIACSVMMPDRPCESSSTSFQVRCPVCISSIHIASSDFPPGLENFIKRQNDACSNATSYFDR